MSIYTHWSMPENVVEFVYVLIAVALASFSAGALTAAAVVALSK